MLKIGHLSVWMDITMSQYCLLISLLNLSLSRTATAEHEAVRVPIARGGKCTFKTCEKQYHCRERGSPTASRKVLEGAR